MGLTFLDGSTPHSSETWELGTGLAITYDTDGTPILSASGGGGTPTAGYVEVTDGDTSPILASRLAFQGSVVSVASDIATFSFDGRYMQIGSTINWSQVNNRPTTLSGYGIIDAYTQTQLQTAGQADLNVANFTSGTLADARLSSNVALRGFNLFTSYQEVSRALATDAAFAARVTGDAELRWRTTVGGTLWWSSGATVADTNLYRYAANILRTDDGFAADSFLVGTTPVITTARVLTNLSADAALITTGQLAWARVASPTTIAGYGITDAYTETEVNNLLGNKSDVGHTHARSEITTDGTPFLVAHGGTGQVSLNGGAILVGNGTAAIQHDLVPGLAGGFVRSNGSAWVRATITSGDLPSHTHTWAQVTSRPTTLAGYEITDAYTQTQVNNLLGNKSDVGHTHARSEITTDGTPFLVTHGGTGQVTLNGGAILVGNGTSAIQHDLVPGAAGGLVRSNGTAWVRSTLAVGDIPSHNHSWSQITSGKPTTIAGYGITDAYTETEVNNLLSNKSNVGHTHPRSEITTDGTAFLVGHGGTGQVSLNGGAILVGNGTSAIQHDLVPGAAGGLVRSNGTAWVRSTLVAGDIPSHNHSWSQITSGRPTTLAGYGITDAVPSTRTVTAGSGLTGGGALSSNITISLGSHDHERLAPVASYTYGAATAPRLVGEFFLTSFVRDTDGWPMTFAKLIHFGSFTSAQDGGAFQILAPYAQSATYNNGKPMYRSGVYSNQGWSAWETFASESWVTTNFAAVSHNHSAANITSGTLTVARGGTGRGTLTTGAVLVGAATTAVSMIAPTAAAQFLRSTSASAVSFSAIQASDLPVTHANRHTFNGGIRLPDGSGAAPSVAIGQDDLGFWRNTTNRVGLAGGLDVTRSLTVVEDITARSTGTHPAHMGNFGTPYESGASWWRGGNAHYAMFVTADDTYLNATSPTGTVHVRAANVQISTFNSGGQALTGSFSATGEVQARSTGVTHPTVTMGVHPNFPSSAAWWRGGWGTDYTMLSDTINTYINATSTGGIYLRTGNATRFMCDYNGFTATHGGGSGTLNWTPNVLTMNRTDGGFYPYIEWQYAGARGAYMGWGAPGTAIDLTMNTGITLRMYGNNGAATIATFAPTLVSVTPNMTVSGYVTASTFYTSSSRKTKFDIKPWEGNALEILRKVDVTEFRYLSQPDELQIGFIAEDVDKILVSEDRRYMKPTTVSGVLIKGVQELEARVRNLENRLSKYEVV